MFKNLTIVSKIIIGFGILFSLLLGISIFSFYSIDNSKDSFNQYRDLAKDSVLAGRLQANMLLVRLYTNRFLKTGSHIDVREYKKREKLMLRFIGESALNIRKPERAKKVALIHELVDNYIESFDRVVTYKKERNEIIYKFLDPNGLAMRKAMTDIIESAHKDGDLTAAYYAGRIQEHLLLGRLYATKFLDTNKIDTVQRFDDELGLEIDPLYKTMIKELQNPERIALFKVFQEKRGKYKKNFSRLVDIILDRNSIIKNELDRIGPIIANAAEDIKLSVKADQDALGPRVKKLNETIILRIIYICVVSLLIAIALGFLIIRAIRNPIKALVETVNEFAEGKLCTRIKIQSGDELGILANAFNSMVDQADDASQKQSGLNWLATSRINFEDKIRGIQEVEDMTDMSLDYIVTILNAQVGAFYIADNSHFRFSSGYACKKEEIEDKRFELGEGLLGQAAKKKEIVYIRDIPEDYISPSIASSIGNTKPKNIIAIPILYINQVLGVIELAKLEPFSALEIELLNQIKVGFGIALNAVFANVKLKTLLDESETLGHQLQVQQEELKQSNEELQESEQKSIAQQEELQSANEDLEENAQYLQSQQKEIKRKNIEIGEKARDLEMSSRYKSEFLANMSHELRTPLNSILLLARYLSENKRKNLEEKDVEMARNIHSSGNSLLSLINDILDLAKIESGQTELSPMNININKYAEFIGRSFDHLAEEKELSFDVKVSGELPVQMYTDQKRLEQIINNFISNALKFTSSGSISVNVSRPERGVILKKCGLSIDKAIAFSVSDTGEGIPVDRQGIVFEAFKQVDGSTSRKHGGTGLGLSISRDLASLMGGEIQLKSEIGDGSTFTLYLPEVLEIKKSYVTHTVETSGDYVTDIEPSFQTVGYDFEDTPMPVMTIPDDREDLSTEDRSILIIEDDDQFASILIELGRENGFKCLISESGEGGLKLAYEYSPNAIILDIVLPGMNGWVVMDNLKSNSKTRHIPVHFCSIDDHKKTAMRIGAMGYLTKPVSTEQIEETFSRIEQFISSKIRSLLVVENDQVALKHITEVLGNGDIKIFSASTGNEAVNMLESERFDCVVLDLGVKDISGYGLLEFIKKEKALSEIPVIIYSENSLTEYEEEKLKEYSESIVVKNAKSPDMLLDEVGLFLHRVEAKLPGDKQKMIRMVHGKELVLKNKKILLVDDDMRNVFALKSFLEDKKMEVLVGANGEECLKCLEKDPEVDIVLMDIMMPKMDGYEAMRRIRKQKKFKNLPIIALTAKAMKTDRAKCVEAGADDYLAKPVDIDRLTSLLHVWLYK